MSFAIACTNRRACRRWSACRSPCTQRSSRRLLIVPAGLASRTRRTRPTTVMTISLRRRRRAAQRRHDRDGRTPGAGGDAARAPKREAVRPPAAKTPEMTVPAPNAKPAKTPPPAAPVKQAPDEARGRTPTRGAETTRRQRGRGDRRARAGLRPVDRRRRRIGVDARRRELLLSRLSGADDRAHPQQLDARRRRCRAPTIVKFTIQRDGTIGDVELEKSSGYHDARI